MHNLPSLSLIGKKVTYPTSFNTQAPQLLGRGDSPKQSSITLLLEIFALKFCAPALRANWKFLRILIFYFAHTFSNFNNLLYGHRSEKQGAVSCAKLLVRKNSMRKNF